MYVTLLTYHLFMNKLVYQLANDNNSKYFRKPSFWSTLTTLVLGLAFANMSQKPPAGPAVLFLLLFAK